MSTVSILDRIMKEKDRVSHRGWPEDLVRGAAIVAEEAGEVVKAALEATSRNSFPDASLQVRIQHINSELIQTAAVCVRYLEYLEELKCQNPSS